jgi:excisionase family DNA binding protein
MKPLTTGIVSKILGVAPRTVSKWIDTGRLKGYRLPGSLDRRVTRESLVQFLADHNMPPLDGELSRSVLLIGLDQSLEASLRLHLTDLEIVAASNAFETGRICVEMRPGAVVIDARIGPAEARRTAQSIRASFKNTLIIGLSVDGNGDADIFDELFSKPLDIELLAKRLIRRIGTPSSVG